ncbi:uncharacterized protein LOC124896173 [Capsicum annuum]|uniref:uncharacterized protein LOC124896173 n=1 Tax=Capsicum annuum TaxID=4072 RepID=UPI001FB0F057|nr:uncharacterized protein LOC124896173 [Capsicum annuum]
MRKAAMLNNDMDISRLVVYIQQASSSPKAQGDQAQSSGAQSVLPYSPCHFCGQLHRVYCKERSNRCYNYGQRGHMQRNYPSAKVATRANKVLVATSLAPAPKDATSCTGTRKNHLYALATC